jgi:hypothetical protein
MFTNDLYKTALCNPAKGNSSLYIVSGYSSATFTNRHLTDLKAVNKNIDVNLIIGMKAKTRHDHQAFLNLKRQYKNLLNVYYIEDAPEVHAKAYSWLGSDPIGFSGSANYSQYAFIGSQVNQLQYTDPNTVKTFYDALLPRAIPITSYKPTTKTVAPIISHQIGSVPPGQVRWDIPGVSARISFLDRYGVLPIASGINWGHSKASKNKNRPNVPRNRNDSYLGIRKYIRDQGFLPDLGYTFTLIGDDGYSMDCKVQQSDRKSVVTKVSHTILGKYLRKRFGLKSGQLVTANDLTKYGRTDFTLTKLDDETFELDISVNKSNQVS